MEEKQIQFKGKNIFYKIAGNGPLVVLLHGFGEDGRIWKNQASLATHCRLLMPDLPGTGTIEAIDDMSMQGMAEVVKAIIDDEAKLADGKGEKVTLIGHSMGGYIALAFAAKYPDSLNGLGLFHSTAFADSEEKKETRRKGISFIKEHGAAEFLKTTIPNLYAPQTKQQHPQWIAEHLQLSHNFSAASLVNYYTAMMQRHDRKNVLIESNFPVLFIMGRYDTAVPVNDGLRQCHLPQLAYIHILEKTGHTGMIEEEEESNKILLQFITNCATPTPT